MPKTTYEDVILDTIEAFLEGAPQLEDDDVQVLNFGPHLDYDMTPDARRMEIDIDGVGYVVTVERLEQ